MTEATGQSQFQAGLSIPDYVGDEESTSICPLLTPSPSDLKMCTSPDYPTDGKLLMTSSGYMQDPESVSMCPLLESSPPPDCFRHALDPLGVLAYEGNPDSSEMAGYVTFDQSRDSRSSSLPGSNDMRNQGKRGSTLSNMQGSSSSSSSALQDNPACVQLLTNHHYQPITNDKPQENGKTPCIDLLSGKKMAADYCFVNWNWRVIRMTCFSSAVSLTLVCFCVVIGMVATVPKTCYPSHTWFQGTVFYEIFPASFQDSGHDGLGDLRGVASRTEYFRKLGVSAIRLNSIFPAKDYPEAYQEILNLTAIDHRLGTINDLHYLISVLHSKNISLVIDLPIYPIVRTLGELKITTGRTDLPIRKDNIAEKITNVVQNHRSHRSAYNSSEVTPARLMVEERSELSNKKSLLNPYIDGGISGLMKVTSEHLKSISQTAVEEALNYWFSLGVDGVYIKGLENYIDDPNFFSELKHWNKIKETYGGAEPKMLMASYDVLENCDNDENTAQILQTFDLLDVFVDVSNGTQFLADRITHHLKGAAFNDKHSSWLHWNVGNVDKPRLSSRVSNNLGAILFQSALPGSISVFYGDEIGLRDSIDPHGDRKDLQDHYQLSPMKWIDDSTSFTPNSIHPWLPYGSSDSDPVTSRQLMNNITNLRKIAPSIYMKVITKGSDTLLNTVIRYRDPSLIVIERFYPRRNTFGIFYNTDVKDIKDFDASHVFYGGYIEQDSEGKSGDYVSFKKFSIMAGESFLVKFDR